MINQFYTNAHVSFRELRGLDEQGKNSRVFLAYDKNLDCNLVIKEIKKDIFDYDRYFNEARKLYLSIHPNIVQIQYAAQDSSNVYIGLPFYKNGSIHNLMNEKPLTVSEIIRYSIQFLSGLYHIHTKGLIHFDIKPNNILLSDRNEALLSDFGLAERINDAGFASPDMLYNLHRPPESFLDEELDFTADIYEAGVTMYRMLVGHEQFNNEVNQLCSTDNSFELMSNAAFPFKNYPLHVPKSIIKIVNKCLEKNKKDRYQSVQQILNDLSKIESSDSLHWRIHPSEEKIEWIGIKKGAKVSIEFDIIKNKCYGIKELSNGKSQKISEYCKDSVKESDIRSLLTK
ncbi:serine/threonine-protein kinase [Xenorhabdus thuongxuanensis]|uniref:Protein kinase n=1 Tax=Xenorhabdus thuongxuanensis TaxID=1873484 RepID=A0A1Q5U3S4_9GAMM|nr:serine/threonine-protein kinase [Xenorhabdus thuongxuanensis]OKP07106.1 protein kinase [Xenorhabdus thuongxuanensis]